MGYVVGLLKYWVKRPFTNPVAFYSYGAGLLALAPSIPYLFAGSFVQTVATYFVVKCLPPMSLEQVVAQ